MRDWMWDIEPRLRQGLARHHVPGASLALYADGALTETASGLLNIETGVEATPQSLFHIASITKPITATMAMQLVEEGRLELDRPVRHYLPNFTLRDKGAAESVTVRQLMCHSSGIDGDFFFETTKGSDRLAKLIDLGRDLPQLHAPGQGFSYCNHGFHILGHICEVVTGQDFDDLWLARIAGRLGTRTLLTDPREALRHRVAVGHRPTRDGLELPRQLFLSTTGGPAGATPMARARDLVAFALMHLNGGATREGSRMLTPESVHAMREPQTPLAPLSIAAHFGLGWMLFDWGGDALFGHDGSSIFQRSYLRICPRTNMIFALLTNGGDGGGLFRDLASAFFAQGGVAMPGVPAAQPAMAIETKRYVGTYERRGVTQGVSERDGVLMLSSAWTDDWARAVYGVQGPFPLEPVSEETFLWRIKGAADPGVVHFINPDAQGRFQSLHAGLRLNHRAAG